MVDYWAVLGLERGAGPDNVKAAYRQLQKMYHPDSPMVRELVRACLDSPILPVKCRRGTASTAHVMSPCFLCSTKPVLMPAFCCAHRASLARRFRMAALFDDLNLVQTRSLCG